jgi:hypothetical protein
MMLAISISLSHTLTPHIQILSTYLWILGMSRRLRVLGLLRNLIEHRWLRLPFLAAVAWIDVL